MECLICTEPIVHAHLGVNSCRACAVFYKRAVNVPVTKLKCKGGDQDCIKQNPRTTCRACRYARFREVLIKAGHVVKGNEESGYIPCSVDTAGDGYSDSEEEEEEQKASTSSQSFLNHETFLTLRESAFSVTPLLDKIKKGYSLMCIIRKSGEMGTYTAAPGDVIIRKGNIDYTPTTYLNFKPNTRIFLGALEEFANFAFEDFRNLDDDSKNLVVQSVRFVMAPMDQSYRITHTFPGEKASNLLGYTTYFNIDKLERLFDHSPDDLDKEGVIR
ncbi:hypothetical protein PFISCL1PPCAC_13394, partial [Pristionchus fissidentatus]